MQTLRKPSIDFLPASLTSEPAISEQILVERAGLNALTKGTAAMPSDDLRFGDSLGIVFGEADPP